MTKWFSGWKQFLIFWGALTLLTGAGAPIAVAKIIHIFDPKDDDGANPVTTPIVINNKLFGTTPYGGSYGYGTIYSIDLTNNNESILYSFQGGTAGGNPGYLLSANDKIYGTTGYGGNTGCGDTRGCGVVFEFDPTTGVRTLIYTFCALQNCSDGNYPERNMLYMNGSLYGVTGGGGAYNLGVLYSLDLSTGTETVLHSFQEGKSDGFVPESIIMANGIIYGTTFYGGSYCYAGSQEGCGIVFSFNPATVIETVLHSFGGAGDGLFPMGLVEINSILYGLTEAGGYKCGGNPFNGDCGTIFELDPNTGQEAVLHAFKFREGIGPENAPISVNGKLYGTNVVGGKHRAGTVFSFDPSTNVVKVVNSFGSGGVGPYSSLFADGNHLYGTTMLGGYDTCFDGCGTVFSVKLK